MSGSASSSPVGVDKSMLPGHGGLRASAPKLSLSEKLEQTKQNFRQQNNLGKSMDSAMVGAAVSCQLYPGCFVSTGPTSGPHAAAISSTISRLHVVHACIQCAQGMMPRAELYSYQLWITVV